MGEGRIGNRKSGDRKSRDRSEGHVTWDGIPLNCGWRAQESTKTVFFGVRIFIGIVNYWRWTQFLTAPISPWRLLQEFSDCRNGITRHFFVSLISRWVEIQSSIRMGIWCWIYIWLRRMKKVRWMYFASDAAAIQPVSIKHGWRTSDYLQTLTKETKKSCFEAKDEVIAKME